MVDWIEKRSKKRGSSEGKGGAAEQCKPCGLRRMGWGENAEDMQDREYRACICRLMGNASRLFLEWEYSLRDATGSSPGACALRQDLRCVMGVCRERHVVGHLIGKPRTSIVSVKSATQPPMGDLTLTTASHNTDSTSRCVRVLLLMKAWFFIEALAKLHWCEHGYFISALTSILRPGLTLLWCAVVPYLAI